MKLKIPLPLQQEHEALHERLRLATQAGGEVGEAARTLAQLMHPHFIKEHQGIVAALKRCVMPQRKRAAATSSTMQTPAFFDAVPAIFVVDPLADALGAVEGGLIEYRYIDAVKLAGHSCPTVAGAWLMTRAALARLYPGETPRRGKIRVEMRQALDEGVAGVIAGVASLVTGAANEGGFKGLAGACD
jgi:hypothetical protein